MTISHENIHTYNHTNIHTCKHTNIHTYIHTNIKIYINTDMYTYNYTSVQIYKCINISTATFRTQDKTHSEETHSGKVLVERCSPYFFVNILTCFFFVKGRYQCLHIYIHGCLLACLHKCITTQNL